MKKIIYYTAVVSTILHVIVTVIFAWMATLQERVCTTSRAACISEWVLHLIPLSITLLISAFGWEAAHRGRWFR